jgi:HPr kinase/phosphorylase
MSIHGTAIAFGEAGVLIRGVPGSGKSTLALRLIDAEGFGAGNVPLRAKLVADDQVELTRKDDGLFASPPPLLAGLLELRGIGIMPFPYQPSARIVLVVDLVADAMVNRLPDQPFATIPLEGINLPGVILAQSDPSSPAKLRSALSQTGLLQAYKP